MGPSSTDRTCIQIAPNVYRMDQAIQVSGQETGYDATGQYWVVGVVRVLAGQVQFLVDDRKINSPSNSFGIVMPPHSVMSVVVESATTINSAVFSKTTTPGGFPKEAIAFALPEDFEIEIVEDIKQLLLFAKKGIVPIGRCSNPHPKSRRLKDYLSEHFAEKDSLTSLGTQFKMAPSKLSSVFRKDWGKAPIHFRNFLRIMDSFRHIAEETAITDVAFDVGFNDLSRFHKQFKSSFGDTPFSIRKRSKNAK